MSVLGASHAQVSRPSQRERAFHVRDVLASLVSDAASRLITLSLLGAAAVELVTLRLGLRSAVHIPGLTPLDGAVGAGAEVGRFAFSLATVLVLLLLVLFAARAVCVVDAVRAVCVVHGAALIDLAAAAGISAMLVGAAGATAGVTGDLTLGVFSLVGLGLLLPRAAFAVGRAGAAAIVAMTAGFALALMVVLLPLGEGLALGGAIGSPLLPGPARPSRRALALATLAGLGTLGLLLGDPAVAKNLSLWTFGLAGYFPVVVYAAAASGLSYTALVAYEAGRLPVAAGVGLLTIGGIGLHSTYQTAGLAYEDPRESP